LAVGNKYIIGGASTNYTAPYHATIYAWEDGVWTSLITPPPISYGYNDVSISPNSQYIAFSGNSFAGTSTYHYRLGGLLDMSTGTPTSVTVSNINEPLRNLWGTNRFSPDGKYLMKDNRLIDMDTGGNPSYLLSVPTGTISQWSPDSRFMFCTISAAPWLAIYDMITGLPVRVLPNLHVGTVALQDGSFHPSGNLFIAAMNSTPFLTALRTISEDSIIPANFNEAAWMSNNPTFFGGFGFAGENANKGDITTMNVLDFY
jgi:hypothetical protein